MTTPLQSGTSRESELVCEIGDERFLVASPAQAKEAGGRHWDVQRVPSQEAAAEPFSIPMGDFSEGYGFTYEGIPGTYDRASGWDATVPGKPTTWPRRATGAPFTSEDARGWMETHGGYLYAMRGRYAVKYILDDTKSATWAIVERHDFDASTVVAGRPVIFKGKMYVPLRTSGGGANKDFHELTTVNTTSAEIQDLDITGTPTTGTFTVSYEGIASTLTACQWDATSAAVQTHLRDIPMLEDCTVGTRTGSTPNFNWPVTMTGAGSGDALDDPALMTIATAGMDGGGGVTSTEDTSGTTDKWTDGPDTREARCFTVWQDKIVLASDNLVYTCSDDPMVVANWLPTAGSGYAVGNDGEDITDLGTHDRFLLVGKTNGLWTFDENHNTVNELEELKDVIDASNCIGMEQWNGYTLIPHKAGLIKWRPGAYEIVGPEMEGALEGDISRGWGRVSAIARFGRYAFYTVNDAQHTRGAVSSLQPPRKQRSPVIPQMHQEAEDANFEAISVLSALSQPVSPRAPATWTSTAGVGSIAWTDPTNAGASDNAYATAGAGTSVYLKGVAPGFSIPTGATITGVKVDVERSAVSGSTPPSFRAAASAAGDSTSATVTKPAGTVDDDVVVVALHVLDHELTITAPSGWTLIESITGSSSNSRTFNVYYKAASSEGASWTWTLSASDNWYIGAMSYQNADPSSPIDVSNIAFTGTNSLSQPAPSVTTTIAQAMLVSGLETFSQTAPITSLAPAGMTERVEENDSGGTPPVLLTTADVVQVAAGASGTKIFTIDQQPANALVSIAFTLALRPASDIVDNVVSLFDTSDGVTGDNKADTSAKWPSSDASVSYGGATDLWGKGSAYWKPLSTGAAGDVNDDGFGLVLSATVTDGTAQVDYATITVYYSVAGVADPQPLLAALHIDEDRTAATPYIYQLPRSGMTIANDPGVAKAASGVSIRTSRYFRPQRGIQKTYEEVEGWAELDPEANTPGLELWFSVDGADDVQLLDTDGSPVTFTTDGFMHAWFPKAAAAVGHYCQIVGKVPATTGGEVDVAVSFRDLTLRGSWVPLRTEMITAVLIIGGGEFSDRSSMRRTVEGQKALLESLASPAGETAPLAYKDIYGNSGYLTIQAVSFRELKFKGAQDSTLVATVKMRAIPDD